MPGFHRLKKSYTISFFYRSDNLRTVYNSVFITFIALVTYGKMTISLMLGFFTCGPTRRLFPYFLFHKKTEAM